MYIPQWSAGWSPLHTSYIGIWRSAVSSYWGPGWSPCGQELLGQFILLRKHAQTISRPKLSATSRVVSWDTYLLKQYPCHPIRWHGYFFSIPVVCSAQAMHACSHYRRYRAKAGPESPPLVTSSLVRLVQTLLNHAIIFSRYFSRVSDEYL